MGQLPTADGLVPPPPFVRISEPSVAPPQLGLALLAVTQGTDAEQLLNLTTVISSSRDFRGPPLSSKWQVSCHPRVAVLQDPTSVFELCLQHGAAERRFRVAKPQTVAWKSDASVSTLPDAAVIEFDSSHSTAQVSH